MAQFPVGTCGVTSEMLGHHLCVSLGVEAMYVCGERYEGESYTTHAWVSCCGLTVDITADQFGWHPVYVGGGKSWHCQWSVEDPPRPTFSLPPPSDQWPYFPSRAWHAINTQLRKVRDEEVASLATRFQSVE